MDCNDADEVFLDWTVKPQWCHSVVRRSELEWVASAQLNALRHSQERKLFLRWHFVWTDSSILLTLTFLGVVICTPPSQPPSFRVFLHVSFTWFMVTNLFLRYILHAKELYNIEILTAIVTTKSKLYFNRYLPRYFKTSVRPYYWTSSIGITPKGILHFRLYATFSWINSNEQFTVKYYKSLTFWRRNYFFNFSTPCI